MIKSLNITDGDLLMINLGSADKLTQKYIDAYGDHLRKWLKNKGLNNCVIQVSAGYSNEFVIAHYTVNDPFENNVLKGDSNG